MLLLLIIRFEIISSRFVGFYKEYLNKVEMTVLELPRHFGIFVK